MLGAAWIAGLALLPAIKASRNGRAVALASRRAKAGAKMAKQFGLQRLYDDYERVLANPEVDAVYIPLVNNLHLEWAQRALRAGKHVLCEKPLAMNAAEAEEMAAVARHEGRLLMEAFMYRFSPRVNRLREEVPDARFVHAAFGFTLDKPDNYRTKPELGGGALLDVGCYCVNVSRWFLGEPVGVMALAHMGGGVDLTTSAVLSFAGGRAATAWGSFESPERQLLVVVDDDGPRTLERPFTQRPAKEDSYTLMVEAFADAALSGSGAPYPVEDSIANMRVLDAIRDRAGINL